MYSYVCTSIFGGVGYPCHPFQRFAGSKGSCIGCCQPAGAIQREPCPSAPRALSAVHPYRGCNLGFQDQLWVLPVSVLMIRTLLYGVCIRAPDFWHLPFCFGALVVLQRIFVPLHRSQQQERLQGHRVPGQLQAGREVLLSILILLNMFMPFMNYSVLTCIHAIHDVSAG